MKKDYIIKLKNVSKVYSIKNKDDFFALKDITLNVKKGEKLAILGANGAGKTTLLKLLAGIAQASSGEVEVKGKVVSLISLTAGFHPEFTGRENLYLNASLLGLTQKEIRVLEDRIIEFSGIRDFIDQALYTYSSGMTLRLGFAIAIHADPDILILDEEIIVGDQDFQAKAYEKIESIFEQGKTIIVSSHWLDFLRRLCNKFVWLDKGEIREIGGEEVLLAYKKQKIEWWKEKNDLSDQPSKEIFQLFRSLSYGDKFKVLASSSSMEPCILKGDELVAERTPLENLTKGDIVVFWSDEESEIIVHRLLRKTNSTLVTKGDSNIAKDKEVDKSKILGKVISIRT